ncbi:DUF4180 domain-containing protein [Persicitalea jodogahamensis]|uniref:DUF4180 domain-containing protein n=1 Tax=Persicitalea jodogahamensis TaxID=402147 RepID=A0A8J3D4I9_9BACT|nr:DUF4180 domain-containing protein [Persicitalea jodogahamensis]GHB72637.1 hypothetical protein GCM10007390_28400 [Persicitalea jodogahamensis]
MEIITHTVGRTRIAEVLSDKVFIQSPSDGLDLLANLYYQDFDRIIIHEQNITPDFFDLKNGLAGEILQKFSNYRVRLAIVGTFGKYPKKSIKDFIAESNRGSMINFVSSTALALEKLL